MWFRAVREALSWTKSKAVKNFARHDTPTLQACKTKTVLDTDKPFGVTSEYISESVCVQPFRKILKNECAMRFQTRRFVCRELFDKAFV